MNYECRNCWWKGTEPSITDASSVVERDGKVEVDRTHLLVCPECFSIDVRAVKEPETPQVRLRPLKRVLCFFGAHWSGVIGLGMYGDAARCDVCGRDSYDVFIINPRNASEEN